MRRSFYKCFLFFLFFIIVSRFAFIPLQQNNEMQSADEDVADDGEATDSSISSNTSNGAPSRKRRHFDADKVIATALNYLSTTEPARDELWQFMSYLHNVLKKLPAHLQMELKQKIQKAMCEVESHDASSKPANGAPAEKEVVPEN